MRYAISTPWRFV